MQSFLTYDLSAGQGEVKNEMYKKGYFSKWVAENITYHLPESSLWKPDCELKVALMDLQSTISLLNLTAQFINNQIKLKRCIVTPVVPWDGIAGEAI